MKTIYTAIYTFILALGMLNAQVGNNYDYGRIGLASGFFIEGTQLSIGEETVSITKDNVIKKYEIENIKSIYYGEKQSFSWLGAAVGTIITGIPTVLLGADLIYSYGFLSIVGISFTGGVITGFLTSSNDITKVNWHLIYSN